VGLATGLGSIITGLLTVRTNTQVEELLNDVHDGRATGTREDQQRELTDLQDRGHTLALTTDILWGTTTALAITTLVLGFFTRFHAPASSLELEVGGSLSAESALLTAQGRF